MRDRDFRQDTEGKTILRCDECHVDYIVPEGEGLPCKHNNKGEEQ